MLDSYNERLIEGDVMYSISYGDVWWRPECRLVGSLESLRLHISNLCCNPSYHCSSLYMIWIVNLSAVQEISEAVSGIGAVKGTEARDGCTYLGMWGVNSWLFVNVEYCLSSSWVYVPKSLAFNCHDLSPSMLLASHLASMSSCSDWPRYVTTTIRVSLFWLMADPLNQQIS